MCATLYKSDSLIKGRLDTSITIANGLSLEYFFGCLDNDVLRGAREYYLGVLFHRLA